MQTKFRIPYGKPDANQGPIVKLARRLGASVRITSILGRGFPDAIIGFERRNLLWEFKTKDGKLGEDQVDFAATWRGAKSMLIRTGQDAVYALAGKPAPPPMFGQPALVRVTLEYADGRRETIEVEP